MKPLQIKTVAKRSNSRHSFSFILIFKDFIISRNKLQFPLSGGLEKEPPIKIVVYKEIFFFK